MKQRWIFGITFALILALLCASCTGFFEIEGKEKITNYTETKPDKQTDTFVRFDNSLNAYNVDVFSNHIRSIRVATVLSRRTDGLQKWRATGNTGYDFYLSFYIPVAGNDILYIPADTRASTVTAVIDDGITNTVYIPNLQLFVNSTEPLFDDVFLAVKNNFTSAIQVVRNSTSQTNVSGSTQVRYGETALFRFPAGGSVSSGCTILVQGNQIPLSPVPELDLPATTFQRNYLYEVEFDGFTAKLLRCKPLTLGSL